MNKTVFQTLVLTITFSFNNIFYILSNLDGKILFWTTSGIFKYKGLKKISLNSIKMNLMKFLI